MLGERAARKLATEPYDRKKLRKAVKQLRELTHHPLESVVPEVKSILAGAGVALVILPIMKESALRGCTKLLSPSKAMIIHGLKFRSLSQFWIVLFHEEIVCHSQPRETKLPSVIPLLVAKVIQWIFTDRKKAILPFVR